MADLVFDAPAVKKKTPIHLADLTPAERKARAVELDLPPFRANQLAVHFFTHHNDDVESFTDIPKDLQAKLGEAFLPKLLTLVKSVTCDGGKTRKDLYRLHDGVLVESVLMRYTDRTTVCISSQAGCGMQCPFCATGQAGLTRNLTAGEITAQVVMAARACDLGQMPGGPTRLSNVVFMGMGEPMANYKAVMQSIRNITNPQPDGLGIGARSVTYALIRDINDQAWRADLLGRLLRNKNAHVNLIPLNPTPGSKWTASRPEDERAFVETLEGYGVPVTVRDTRGREIDGACGQLAASEK